MAIVSDLLLGSSGKLPDGWNENIEAIAAEDISKNDVVSIRPKDSYSFPTVLGSYSVGAINSLVFTSKTGKFVAVRVIYNKLDIYKCNNGELTYLITLNISSIAGATFSYDDTLLVASSQSAPYFYAYKISGDTFTKLSSPPIIPSSAAHWIRISSDNKYILMAIGASPFIFIYKINGESFTKLSNPSLLPAESPRHCSISYDSKNFAVSGNKSAVIYHILNETIIMKQIGIELPDPELNYTSFEFSDTANYAVFNGEYNPQSVSYTFISKDFLFIYTILGNVATEVCRYGEGNIARGKELCFVDSHILIPSYGGFGHFKFDGTQITRDKFYFEHSDYLGLSGVDISFDKRFIFIVGEGSPGIYSLQIPTETTIHKFNSKSSLLPVGISLMDAKQGDIVKIIVFSNLSSGKTVI